MAKISAYPDGGEVQSTDKFVIARSGNNKSILGDKLIPALKKTIYAAGAGNHVPDAATRYMEVEMIGGGGGGGGADGDAGTAGVGGGGGAGGYLRKLYTAPLAASYAYSVGAAGPAGAAGNHAGTAGGDTTFGALTAPGGNGGASVANGTTQVTVAGGGATAAPTGGDINIPGESGSSGYRLDGSTTFGGDGGHSMLGSRGRGAISASTTGVAAVGYGAGGGGGRANNATDRAGGNGGGGIIIVREYS